MDTSDFEGRNSTWRKSGNKKCPQCKKKGQVFYTGSSVTHGNIYTPAADTEVDHYYTCENCDHQWTEYA